MLYLCVFEKVELNILVTLVLSHNILTELACAGVLSFIQAPLSFLSGIRTDWIPGKFICHLVCCSFGGEAGTEKQFVYIGLYPLHISLCTTP